MPGWTPPGCRLLIVAATWLSLTLLAHLVPGQSDLLLAVGGAAAVAATAVWAARRTARAPAGAAWWYVLAVGALAWGLLLVTLPALGGALRPAEWAVVVGLPCQYLLLLRAGI